MLRTFSLVGMAAQAEGRRIKAQASSTALKLGLYAAAGVLGLAAFVMLHFVIYFAANAYVGPLASAAIVLAVDLVGAGTLAVVAGKGGPAREEMEARAVRNVALTGAAQSAVSGFTTQAAPLLALGGIALAALLPSLRGGRRR